MQGFWDKLYWLAGRGFGRVRFRYGVAGGDMFGMGAWLVYQDEQRMATMKEEAKPFV